MENAYLNILSLMLGYGKQVIKCLTPQAPWIHNCYDCRAVHALLTNPFASGQPPNVGVETLGVLDYWVYRRIPLELPFSWESDLK